MKINFPSHQSHKCGNWSNEHKSERTIRQGVGCSDTPSNTSSSSSDLNSSNPKKQVMTGFNSGLCSTNDKVTYNTDIA